MRLGLPPASTSFLFGLRFHSEDGGNAFFRNVGPFPERQGRHNLEHCTVEHFVGNNNLSNCKYKFRNSESRICIEVVHGNYLMITKTSSQLNVHSLQNISEPKLRHRKRGNGRGKMERAREEWAVSACAVA